MATITGETNLDVELMYKALRLPVSVGPILRSTGWRGGQWVTYINSDEGDFVVEASDGTSAAGFLLFPSEDYRLTPPYGSFDGSALNWTSTQPMQGVGGQNVITMISGNSRFFCKVFETEALDGGARTGGSITYMLNQSLKISENGLLCNDSNAQLALVGIASPIAIGGVAAIPLARNGYRLGVGARY